jgi:outer membrane protein OmpA-like peptidoglycan-associated protein
MIIQPSLLSLFVVITLSACSGTASKKDTSTSPLTQAELTQFDLTKSEEKAQMKIYLKSAQSQLLALDQKETMHCISGQLSIAHSFLAQANQEHNADMNKDAFITLVEFDRQVRKIRCINDYLEGNLGCGYTNKKNVLKNWYSEGEYNQCHQSNLASSPITKPAIVKSKVSESTSTNNKKHIVITETLYDFDKNTIKPIYHQSLNKLIALIKSYPYSTLLISGHTDSKGSSTYNKKLSLQRANNVAKYFTDRGITASQLRIESQGEANLREVETSDVSSVFNRYTSITLFLDNRDKKAI